MVSMRFLHRWRVPVIVRRKGSIRLDPLAPEALPYATIPFSDVNAGRQTVTHRNSASSNSPLLNSDGISRFAAERSSAFGVSARNFAITLRVWPFGGMSVFGAIPILHASAGDLLIGLRGRNLTVRNTQNGEPRYMIALNRRP
jgi:hypothetical protein